MGLFDQLGQQQNPMQMLQQIRQDPVSVLRQAGLNIPANLHDPQQIVQHLMQSGQVPQGRYQQALQMMSRMGRR
jgi:hypothetical protein